ncbi:putative acyltransferase [Mycobacterium xenopi 3993]|nr:putative acyltransferase [Mycobacterium xenopi 3993]
MNTAAQKVRSGWDDLVLAGGVESMSRVPMGSDGGAMALDPATNYDVGFVPQGIGADLIATLEGFSREDVDAYALRSQQRAAAAWSGGYFAKSVVPVRDQNGLLILDHDEHMRPDTTMEGLAKLKPAFEGVAALGVSMTWRCRNTTGWKRSTTSTPAATAQGSSTARHWCSSGPKPRASRRVSPRGPASWRPRPAAPSRRSC